MSATTTPHIVQHTYVVYRETKVVAPVDLQTLVSALLLVVWLSEETQSSKKCSQICLPESLDQSVMTIQSLDQVSMGIEVNEKVI